MPYSSDLNNNSRVAGESISDALNALLAGAPLGKKIVEKILIPVVNTSGSLTSVGTTNVEAQSRASFVLDLNSSRWSSVGTPIIKFRVIGREQTGGNTAHFILYNKTDGVNIVDSEITTILTTVYTVTEVTIPVANLPSSTSKVIQLRMWTTPAGTVELYSAEIEIEWTLF
jgi:hypothetical protein